MKATGEFTVANWNQADLDGVWTGESVMKVDAVFKVSGEIIGSILVAYLMYYSQIDEAGPHNGAAQYTGCLAFRDKLLGKEGVSFYKIAAYTKTPRRPAFYLLSTVPAKET